MSAYLTGTDGEWLDLILATVGVQADGHHSYIDGVDVSVGPLEGGAQTVSVHSEGLSGNTSGVAGTTVCVHAASCSSALAPTLEWVFLVNDGFVIGWGSQDIPDGVSGDVFRDGTYSIYLTSGMDTLIVRHRTPGTVTAGASGVVAGDWVRLTITNTPQAHIVLHKLTSGDPDDWGGGSEVFSYRDTSSVLVGANVLVPFFSGDGSNQRVRAVRVTPGRAV